MIEKPVNQIDLNSNIIKANDVNSVINIKINDVNNNPVNLENEIEYFYLVRNDNYYPVTDITFSNGGISFKLPNLYKGLYKIEIKDKKGSIYPANDDISILLNQSFESGKEAQFISMKDSILNDVPEIINDFINDDPERFKGVKGDKGDKGLKGDKGEKGDKGDKGVQGKQGIQGIKGDKGDKGGKGEKGDKGLDGTMSFEDLTDEQISDLKGDKGDKGDPGEKGDKGDPGKKGDKGDKGDPGSIENSKIGVINKIDITKLTQFGSTTPITEFEIDNGIVHYSSVLWNISQNISLAGVKHSFRVEDYLTNPEYMEGKLIIDIKSLNEESVFYKSVDKGIVYEIDLTGREMQEYIIRFRVTGTKSFSGFIEKPMLVEGDIPVLWSKPIIKGYLSTSFPPTVITSESLSNNGTKLRINSIGAITKNCSVSEGSIVLSPGIWKIDVNVSLESTADKTQLFYIRAIQNSNEIATSRGILNGTTYSMNLVINTNGDPIYFYVVQNSGADVSTLSSSFNRVTAEYLGGV